MKVFIKRTFYFGVYVLSFILFFSFFLPEIISNEPNDSESIYIWGDSQAYHGIDLNFLNKKTHKKCYSLATHGAGVYDFMVFTERVPEFSQVIVSLSKLVLFRNKLADFNRTGIYISALYSLYKNNYSSQELVEIYKKNKINNFSFISKSSLYPNRSKIYLKQSLSDFNKVYNFNRSLPYYINDKQNIYLEGIKKLKSKKCKIIFIEFPFHPKLKKIEDKSQIKVKTQSFNKRVFKLFEKVNIDSIQLRNDKQKMFDLTHLNGLGAKEVTDNLVKILNKKSTNQRIDFLTFIVKK